ncbi:hypothetical protein F383_13144 [Gossypium arboreum]|uniref:Uncharacterized protein n=1 Tax=Gossypium arboreum TaxID=29729 RepID=A0A0B0NKN5_GOSAR|nr:hypothetical protein F383_13144 [Gossypium arboreum]
MWTRIRLLQVGTGTYVKFINIDSMKWMNSW